MVKESYGTALSFSAYATGLVCNSLFNGLGVSV